jgi:hypothetical protein
MDAASPSVRKSVAGGVPGVDRPLTVLALGMLADIVAPLLCVPDVDLLYVIDKIDPQYYALWYEPCKTPKVA